MGGGSATGGGNPSTLAGDHCGNARTLTFNASGVATFTGDNTSYTFDTAASCGDARDSVFVFTVPRTMEIEIEVSGADAWHVRTACANEASELWCSTSTGRDTYTAGTYYLWVEAWNSYTVTARTYEGDLCETATPILGSSATYSGTGTIQNYASDVTSPVCDDASWGPDRAYRFTLSSAQNVTAQLTQVVGFVPNLILKRVSGSSCTELSEVTCSYGVNQGTSGLLRASALPAGDYVLWVKGDNNNGTYTLNVTRSAPAMGETCSAPLNLQFANGSSQVSGDTTPFFPDTNANSTGACGTLGDGNDVVYRFVQSSTGTFRAQVTPTTSGFQPIVYVRAVCSTSDLACTVASTSGGSATVSTLLNAGTYDLVVDSDGAPGAFTLFATQTAMRPNIVDTCASAEFPVVASSGTVSLTGDTTTLVNNYTSGVGFGCSNYGGGKDGVFIIDHLTAGPLSVTATATGTSTYKPLLYLRANCTMAPDLACASNNNGDCSTSTQTFSVSSLAAGRYFLIVDGCGSGNGGAFSLSITQ